MATQLTGSTYSQRIGVGRGRQFGANRFGAMKRKQTWRIKGKPKKPKRGVNSQVPVDQNPQPPPSVAEQEAKREQTLGNPVKPYQPQQSNEGYDPNDMFKSTSYTPSQGQPDPRGPDYWDNLGKLKFQAQQKYGSELRDQSYADINYGAERDQMLTQRARRERDLAESMIGSGLAYSGYHDRSQAEDAQDFVSQAGQFERDFSQSQAARKAAREAIVQGFSIDEAALLSEAVARQQAEMESKAAKGDPEYNQGDIDALTGGKKGKGKKGKGKNKLTASSKRYVQRRRILASAAGSAGNVSGVTGAPGRMRAVKPRRKFRYG